MTVSGDSERGASAGRTAAPSREGRGGLRILCAWAPWLALAAAVTMMALWWTQRPWPMRLAGCAVLVAWLLGWSRQAVGSDSDTRFRAPLLWLAVPAVLLGLLGLVFGLATVPVALSAWLASAGALLFAIAAIGSPLARGKALTAGVSSLLALTALEAGVRGLGIGETARESDSRELARRFNNLTPPRSAFVNRPRPLDEFPPASIEINSIGIRGPEILTGKVDLLLLGDSFIEARQLPWEDTLGPRLQAALRARSSAARVVGHGMRGWSPLLEWNWYLKVGRRLKAERVLLFFFWNDLWPAGTEVQTFRAVLGPDGRPDHFDVLLDPGWIWYRHVRTVRLIEEAVRLAHARSVTWSLPAASLESRKGAAGTLDEAGARRMARSTAGGPPLTAADVTALLTQPVPDLAVELQDVVKSGFWPGVRPMELWTQEQFEAAASTERELERFAADVASDGGRLVIVYVPNPYQLGTHECTVGRYLDRLDADVTLPGESGVQAWLSSVSTAHGIEILDPTTAMRRLGLGAAPGSSPLYLRADCHWSPTGHQFMADWLAEWYLSGRVPER